MPDEIKIGDLRWEVTLARRTHAPDEFDTSDPELREVYSDRRTVFADIRPVGTNAFLSGQQLDTGAITHRITVRHKNSLSIYDVVLRTRKLADGSTEDEVYQIKRVADWQGRQSFTIIEAELEARR